MNIPASPALLPDPDSRVEERSDSERAARVKNPGRSSAVVIWDGECRFCRKQVLRLRSLDWWQQLTFLSLHDARVSQRYPQLSHEQLMAEMWVVPPRGKPVGGADALRWLSRTLPALWPLAPLLHVPLTRPLWRALYGWIARQRYRLAGKDCDGGTCELHAHRATKPLSQSRRDAS